MKVGTSAVLLDTHISFTLCGHVMCGASPCGSLERVYNIRYKRTSGSGYNFRWEFLRYCIVEASIKSVDFLTLNKWEMSDTSLEDCGKQYLR